MRALADLEASRADIPARTAMLAWKASAGVALGSAAALLAYRGWDPNHLVQMTLGMAAGGLAHAAAMHWPWRKRRSRKAQIDMVTDLPDRRAFEEELGFAQVKRHREVNYAAVLMLDVDGFDDLNDQLGHQGGDALLREIGRRISKALRPGDIAARLGADEFAILLTSLAKPDDAERVAARIQQILAEPVAGLGPERQVSVTIGIAVQNLSELDHEELMKNAGLALRLAKTEARGGTYVFMDAMRRGIERRRKLEAAIRRGTPAETFTLAYQPKYDVQDETIIGFEALIRWNCPENGFVSPAELIPILEDTGLIVEVGAWVLETACKTLKHWQVTLGRPELTMAVNLSTRQLQDPGLVETVRDILGRHDLKPTCVELEVTETMIMQKPERAIAILEALRSEGVRLSVDDFGTGYSSLQYLKRLPLSTIKVDRSFVMSLPSDNDLAIVHATINLGKALGLTVVAEGVEKAEHLAILKSFGCDHAQGFFFSKPVPAADAEALLRKMYPQPQLRVLRAA